MLTPKRSFLQGLLVMLVVLALDQLSKWLILAKIIMPPDHMVIEVAPFFNVVLVWNYGISFGMFAAHRQPFLLTSISAAIVCILLAWLYKNTSKLGIYALGLILGGAMGNIFDRLRFEAVVDFLDFHIANYHWPAFNIADSCIFIGVVLLCSSSMFTQHHNQTGLKS